MILKIVTVPFFAFLSSFFFARLLVRTCTYNDKFYLKKAFATCMGSEN